MQDNPSTERLRARFNEAAELYDRARPGYPEPLFDDLVALASLPSGARILEIGCGTGQATLPLARRGFQIVAVELGAELAAVARRNLAPFPRVEVHTATFEQWPLPAEPFDLVLGATSWHWVDPEIRFEKAANALRDGGHLALIQTQHVAGGTAQFFEDVQVECYPQWMNEDPTLRLTEADALSVDTSGFEESGRFEAPAVRLHAYDEPYTTQSYIDVLNTYSGHRDLADDRRAGLLDCISSIIDTRYGGAIVKRYRNDLLVARRR